MFIVDSYDTDFSTNLLQLFVANAKVELTTSGHFSSSDTEPSVRVYSAVLFVIISLEQLAYH